MADNNSIRNIWVFGGTGFIGSALVKQLAKDPQNRIHLLIHKNFNPRELESFNTFQSDLGHFDFQLFDRYPPDRIFHLARFAGRNSFRRKYASWRANKANQKFIHYLQKLESPPQIVYVSGSLMYGEQKDDETGMENSPLQPVSYATYYIKAELPWIHAQKEKSLDIRFARPAWIVGPSSWFVEFFWKPFKEHGKVPIYGSGEQRMSLIDLNDCALLIEQLSKSGNPCQNLNIFSGPPVSQENFSNRMAEYLKTTTYRVSKRALIRKYDKTTADALTSSVPVSTLHPEIYDEVGGQLKSPETTLKESLAFLKNK
jgi:nucleoside-diphosphate-sugar epimerase